MSTTASCVAQNRSHQGDKENCAPDQYVILSINMLKKKGGGEELRWLRNRTGRPLSPLQIHRKNIWTLSRTFERWANSTKQLLVASRGHQVPRKAAHCLWKEVGQNIKTKRETKELGVETCPRKGVLIEEVSKHQETLSLTSLGEVFESWRAT